MNKFTKWLERRFNPLEDPSKPMTAGAINTLFGWAFGGNATSAGEVVSEFSALQHVTVYSCVRVLSEAVGSLTLRTYERLDKGRSEATDDPVWKMLSLTPNDEMPASVLWENVVGCLALCGNSYVEIVRNKSRQPIQLYPLHALKTEPVRLPSGKLAYRTIDYATGGQRIIAAADVLHFRLFSWDGLKGLSPIQQARQTIGWSVGTLKSSARFFGQGSKPPGILTPVGQVSEEDLVNMRKAWELANGGENQGRTAVLPSDWKYQQLGISNKDSQWLESMQFSRTDISALFRVPAHMVGDTTRMSNNNVEGMNLSFVIDKVDNGLLSDSGFDIESWIRDRFARRFFRGASSLIYNGDAGNVQGLASAFAAGFTSVQTGKLTYPDFATAIATLDPAYQTNAVWAMSNAAIAGVIGLADSNGRPLFLPGLGDATQGFIGTILGKPVKLVTQMPSIATGNAAVLFGDFKAGYTFRQQNPGLAVIRLNERYAVAYQTGFAGFARVGGIATIPNPATPPIVACTIK
jgi:HK97 family phage portal protein